MEALYTTIHKLFTDVPELALFISLAMGYVIGRIPFGSYRLGNVAGPLLAAVLVSQFGVHIDETVQNILFTLFIFAIGFTSGPDFVRSFGRHALKELGLAATLALSGLLCVIVLARLLNLNPGLAAGIAAGALTQSAILGTAESALLGMAPAGSEQLVADISLGYGLTYIIGSLGAILICANLLPRLMGNIRDDAVKAEARALRAGVPIGKNELAVPLLVSRLFYAGPSSGKTVEEVESLFSASPITIERIKRGGALIPVSSRTELKARDKLLIIGRQSALVAVRDALGKELPGESGMEADIRTRELVVSSEKLRGKTLEQIITDASPDMRHGLYLAAVSRGGKSLPATPDTVLEYGDIIALYGEEQDIQRVAEKIGYIVAPGNKTDFVYMGFGLAVGLLLGKLAVHSANFSIALGSCGVLFSGLLFGWFRTRHQRLGSLPGGAARLLKEVGLAGFVVCIGLNHGMQALGTLQTHGTAILLAGILVTILPLLFTMLVGRYLLRYENAAVLAGALAGAHSSNPALGAVLAKAENSVPTLSFTVTYALANVFLTLLGPFIIALV